jgi:hypothetical protein
MLDLTAFCAEHLGQENGRDRFEVHGLRLKGDV